MAWTDGTSTSATWSGWTDVTSSATTTWGYWVDGTSTTIATSTSTSTVWPTWTSATQVVYDDTPVYRNRFSDASLNDFEERTEAKKRAEKILVEHLTQDQEDSLNASGYFDVRVMVDGTRRRFRIHNDKYQHNVFELNEDDVRIRELCAHTSHACPQSDHALAQKLLLEHNPEEFLRVANAWDLRRERALE